METQVFGRTAAIFDPYCLSIVSHKPLVKLMHAHLFFIYWALFEFLVMH